MKRILLSAPLIILSAAIYAQTFQATILSGSQVNSVKAVIVPNADYNNGQLSSMQLTFMIPATVIPRPTAVIINNFITGMNYGAINISKESPNGTDSFYVYNFNGVGDATVPVVNYTNGSAYNILEVGFIDGPASASDIQLAQLPNGGVQGDAPGQYNFYMALGGNDVTNQTAQFFGAGSSNDGQGYGGYSYATISGIALPTKFMSFYAFRQGTIANLTWTVAKDENNDHFDVQRSTDGRNFEKILSVPATRNDKLSNAYSSSDDLSSLNSSTAVYYRIRQIEKDGTGTYSEVRTIQLDKKDVSTLLVPNPAVSSAKLIINAVTAGKATIMIYDLNGKRLQQISIQLQKGINQQDLQVSSLAAGTYNITITGDNNLNQTVKLIKGGR